MDRTVLEWSECSRLLEVVAGRLSGPNPAAVHCTPALKCDSLYQPSIEKNGPPREAGGIKQSFALSPSGGVEDHDCSERLVVFGMSSKAA